MRSGVRSPSAPPSSVRCRPMKSESPLKSRLSDFFIVGKGHRNPLTSIISDGISDGIAFTAGGDTVMSLTDAFVKNLKAPEKPQMFTDGDGLNLRASPAGSKSWRYDYRFQGKKIDPDLRNLSFGQGESVKARRHGQPVRTRRVERAMSQGDRRFGGSRRHAGGPRRHRNARQIGRAHV